MFERVVRFNRKRNIEAFIGLFYTKMIRAFTLCLVLLSFPSFSLQFQQIKLDDSYKQTDFFSITEDQHGYLWLGTMNGLYRYDGREFVSYQTNINDPNSLSNGLSRVVFSDSSGELWVGTQRGLNRYQPQIDGFERYLTGEKNGKTPDVIWGIFESPKGELFVSTDQNFFKWDKSSHSFQPIFSSAQPPVEIKSLAFISNTRVLAASYDRGLFVVDLENSRVLQHKAEPELIQQGAIYHQVHKLSANLYEINTSLGIYQFDLNSNELTPTRESLSVRATVKSKNKQLFLGTEQGLFIESPQNQLLAVDIEGALSPPYIYTLFKDKYDNIWAGGRSFLGLHRASSAPFEHKRVDTLPGSFNGVSITSLDSSSSGLWMLSSANQIIFSEHNSQSETVVAQLPREIQFTINARLRYDSSRELLWLSSLKGLLSFNLKTQELTEHAIFINKRAMHADFDFAIDSDHNIWIANKRDGLLKYQPDSGQTTQFRATDSDNALYSQLETLTIDVNGEIWLGSEHGALRFKPESQQFQHIDLGQTVWITSIAANTKGVWFGTMVNGLFFMRKADGTITRFTQSSGLTDNAICTIVSLPNNDVWLSTSYGISSMTANSERIRSFNYSNSLQNTEYNQHSGTINAQGEVYFGSISGYTRFVPEEILPVSNSGKVHLHSLKVFNQEVAPNGPNQRLSAAIDSLQPIRLLHNDSPFSIAFSYPAPANSDFINYKYRLSGLDNQWLTTNSSNTVATYTNLSPGRYLFEVQAQSQDGLWQSDITQVEVYVASPYWRSSEAYIFYTTIILLLLFALFRHRQQQHQAQTRIAESEERLKLSLWGSGDELWDWHIKTNKIYRSNIWGLLEFPHDGRRSPQKGSESNIHPRDLERVQQALTQHFEGQTSYYEATYRVRNKSSEWLWILDRGKIVERDPENQPLRMTGTIKDISKLKQAEHRLTLFARSIANISDGVFILNRRFRVIEINDAFTQITGFEKSHVLNRRLHFKNYPKSFNEQVKHKLSKQGRWVGELEDERQDGTPFFLKLAIDPIASEEGDITHYVGVFSDITRRKQTESELHRLSVEDTLTKLPNRSWFQAEHQKLVAKKTHHALMVFDLDNFKKVNDSLGHQVGDELLIQVANRLDNSIRAQDTLFRLGGDEYAVLMENTTDVNTISQTVKNLQKALENPFKISQQELVVTSSIGIVLFPLDGNSSEELLRNADTAMYHAKSQGSNGYMFFSTQMNDTAMHQLHIESLIRQAIRDDLFSLHYQPKFSVATGDLEGMEALVRLHHTEHGPISPTEFIPLAEANGLIIEVGDIVLRKACFAAQSWRRQGLMKGRIAVNVSARQFSSAGFIQRIERALAMSGLPAHRLELELTEGALVEDPEGAIIVMKRLRELGIHISLDDFGTGYSSLAYLQRFPIDTLKIDQSFIRNMTISESGLNMVYSIIALAHNLHLSVIAEGVESEKEQQLLAEMKCEVLQGYLLSRPLSQTDFTAFLSIHQLTQQQKLADFSALPERSGKNLSTP